MAIEDSKNKGSANTIQHLDPRLPAESAAAYAAYRKYRQLGPDRTLAAAWQAYRQRSRKAKPGRGRPRLRQVKTQHPSGQWTTWSRQFRWPDRAAHYDALLDAEERRARWARLQEQEQQRCQRELAAQQQCEQRVWQMEALLDRADRAFLPPDIAVMMIVADLGDKTFKNQNECYRPFIADEFVHETPGMWDEVLSAT